MQKETDEHSMQGNGRNHKYQTRHLKVYDMTYIAVFVILIIICSWITVPFGPIPVTLQTFAVFLSVGVLGGKRGSLSVLVYLLIGCIGLPVFSGFQGGVGVLFGQTGGYLLGMIPMVLLMWWAEVLFPQKAWGQVIGMLLGLPVCYLCGTVWFMLVYMKNTGEAGLGAVLLLCVVPFVLPDLIKIGLACLLTGRLKKVLPIIG